MRRPVVVIVGILCLVSGPAARPLTVPPGSVTVRVDASRTLRPLNRDLAGVDWKLGTGSSVDDLHPVIARADIAFQDAAKPDGSFDWSFGDAWVAEAQAAGAEPMLILDYMPAWLARTIPGDVRDPTRLPPRDAAVWEHIVESGVRHFAARGVRWFEVWNEPDWAGFWQDSPVAFLETARHTALAVRRVERDVPDLRFGGPACLFPDPACVAPWLVMMRSIGMRPDFVSWHYYGNYPLVGPDGAEPTFPQPAYLALGHRNPAGGVAPFPLGIRTMRAATALALAGTGWHPELVLDEWNVSAGGFDHRHDTHEGAAFDAGVLAEFQDCALARAAFFISKDAYLGDPAVNPSGVELGGDWGLVSWKGTRKPAWWTFWLWRRMAPAQAPATGGSVADGFWAVAARDPATGRVTVLLSSFLSTGAHAHAVTLRLDGLAPSAFRAEIRRIDGSHPNADVAGTQPVSGPSATIALDLPSNSVVFVELIPIP
jgi:hypothetical protein